MFSAFLMSPAASGRGLCDIEHYSELLNQVSENWDISEYNSIDILQSASASCQSAAVLDPYEIKKTWNLSLSKPKL